MPKGTILDRLAGAMKTLSKREGKALTPRQRVAAAQRWNSLADIADDRLAHMDALSEDIPGIMKDYNREAYAYDKMKLLHDQGNAYDNPFRFDWMGEPYQYEARLKNYRPLTDAQYERMLEREEDERLRGFYDAVLRQDTEAYPYLMKFWPEE